MNLPDLRSLKQTLETCLKHYNSSNNPYVEGMARSCLALVEAVEAAKYYVIGLLVKDGSGALVNKRIFHDEQEARAWAKTQVVPQFAHCFYIECFSLDGTPEWSQGITND